VLRVAKKLLLTCMVELRDFLFDVVEIFDCRQLFFIQTS